MATEMATFVQQLAEDSRVEYSCEVVEGLLSEFTRWLHQGLVTNEEFVALASSLGESPSWTLYKGDGLPAWAQKRIFLSLRTGGFRAS